MGYYHFVLKDQDKNTEESDGLNILDGQNKIKLFTADELKKYDGIGNFDKTNIIIQKFIKIME